MFSFVEAFFAWYKKRKIQKIQKHLEQMHNLHIKYLVKC